MTASTPAPKRPRGEGGEPSGPACVVRSTERDHSAKAGEALQEASSQFQDRAGSGQPAPVDCPCLRQRQGLSGGQGRFKVGGLGKAGRPFPGWGWRDTHMLVAGGRMVWPQRKAKRPCPLRQGT